MNIVIVLLAFYGLTYTFKEASIFDKPRVFLIRLHPFFYRLFSCYFCTGFHAGYIIYLLLNFRQLSIADAFLWGLASATTSFVLNLIVEKLSSD